MEYKKVKDIVPIYRGKRLTKSQLADSDKYEVYHGSKDTILGRFSEFNAPAQTTIIVNTGGIGGVKFLDAPFWCSDGSFWLGQSEAVNPKYLYYSLSRYEDYFYSQKRIGAVPTIDRQVVEELQIQIPPREIQNEIVAMLDRFEALCSDISKGIPAEIAARQKQYEYYRDKLLSFEELRK